MADKSGEKKYRRYYRAIEEIAQKPKTQTYSGPVFSFLAISLFGLYAILPTMRTVLFLRREISDKTLVNTQMEEKISALIQAQAAYEEAGGALDLINQAIPVHSEAVELASQLRNLASVSEASMSSLQVSALPLTGKAATASAQPAAAKDNDFPITMTVVGSYPSLRAFLDGLVELRRIVTIESVRLTPATGQVTVSTSGTPLMLVLKLKAYWKS